MFSGFFIGLLFGLILQRGQFCFVSGFRQFLFQRNLRFITALLIAVSIQSIGFLLLNQFGFITIPSSPMPIAATLLGALLFGVGMALANCCASGGWFRTGEGVVGSMVALFSFVVTLAATQSGALKNGLVPLLSQTSSLDTIPQTLGISPWWLVATLWGITAALIAYQRRFPRYQPPAEATQAVVFPRIFANRWHPYLTAVCLGLLGVAAWYFSEQTGRNYGFGIAIPSANLLQYWVIGQHRYWNWGTLFVLGIPFGAYLAAKLSGEFQLRMPRADLLGKRLLGGAIMGVGAALAGGCTITNSLVSTAYFSWQGWIATLVIPIGFGLAAVFVKSTECRL